MQKKAAIDLRAFLCSIVVLFGLAEFLYLRSELFIYLAGIVSLLAFLVIFPVTTAYNRIVALLLCGSGFLALFFTGEISFDVFIKGFAEMTPLVALMAAITLFALPLELGRYANLFQRFYLGARRPYQPYLVSMVISYFLSFFSSLGAIAPSYYLINQNMRRLGLDNNSRFETTSIARGYAMAVIISPVSVTVGIALKYSGLSWGGMVVSVLVLSLIGLTLAFFIEPSWRGSREQQLLNPASIEKNQEDVPVRRIFSFILLFIGVVSAIHFFGSVLHFSSLNSISLGCLFATVVWGVFSGKISEVWSRSMLYFGKDISKLFDQVLLFFSAGFFTHAMENSGGLRVLGNFIEGATGEVGPIVILAMVPVIIASLSIVGFHPFASGIIIAKTISVSPIFFDPLGFAVALMSGMSIAFMISPFSGLTLMLSSFSGHSPYKVGLRWNIAFATVFYGLTVTFITLVTRVS